MSVEFRLKEKNKILIVDDNKINQLLINKMLGSIGANITTAFDGKEAIEQAQKTEFDLIFMDIQMPVMNGFDATGELRRLGFTLPIIALSADLSEEDKVKCTSVGMNDFLQKPFLKKDWLILCRNGCMDNLKKSDPITV